VEQSFGKYLFILGLILCLCGLALWSGLGRGWLGRLPGDIAIDRGNVSFRFPIVTCLLISLALSAILALFRR
jgi:hypothetical protein